MDISMDAKNCKIKHDFSMKEMTACGKIASVLTYGLHFQPCKLN